MTNSTGIATRAGTSDAPRGTESTHTLIVLVEDRTGAIDRVVGVLRRRRARAHSLTLTQSTTPDIVRITTQIKDAEVAVDQLVAQLRKIVDVRQVLNLTNEQAVVRELALITVQAQAAGARAIIETGQQFGAFIVDITADAVVLEATGSTEKLEQLISALQPFGIREIARSGSVAVTHAPNA
jgi:acetolactate synthase-1/3 small subunit